MPASLRVFFNDRATDVAPGATAREVIAARDPALLEAVLAGRALATDGVGREVPLDRPLAAGAILRVRRTARGAAPSP